MVTIQVVRKSDGKPSEGAQVNTYWNLNMMGKEGRTDRNGEVHLDQESRDCKVVINGWKVHDGRVAGRMVFYI